jgi:hypothetical protein
MESPKLPPPPRPTHRRLYAPALFKHNLEKPEPVIIPIEVKQPGCCEAFKRIFKIK